MLGPIGCLEGVGGFGCHIKAAEAETMLSSGQNNKRQRQQRALTISGINVFRLSRKACIRAFALPHATFSISSEEAASDGAPV